jgi:hypothetical protein
MTTFLLLSGLIISGMLAMVGCGSPTAPNVPAPPSAVPTASNSTGPVQVVVVGDISHGPLQATVQTINDTMVKYGDKVNVSWYDMSTTDGSNYAASHNLTAHMNIVINGKYQYQVNGKAVVFQWFEGQSWTGQDLDAVIAGLVSK